uniref:T-cell receptor alpha/delta variable 23.3.8 n=1 Tax=Sinocyclocheilus grahami TaxID=75366 RepID=A0A672PJP1_SINGR
MGTGTLIIQKMKKQWSLENLNLHNPDKEKNFITKETETVKLSCSYSTTSNDVRLYWYRQYLHGEIMFLAYKGARSLSAANTADDRFHATTTHTSTELTITDVRLSDSALYYCALRVAQ